MRKKSQNDVNTKDWSSRSWKTILPRTKVSKTHKLLRNQGFSFLNNCSVKGEAVKHEIWDQVVRTDYEAEVLRVSPSFERTTNLQTSAFLISCIGNLALINCFDNKF